MALKEIAVFCNLTVWGIQKFGIILENKMSEKSVFYPKWSPKWYSKMKKNPMFFGQKKLTLKVLLWTLCLSKVA